MFTLFALRTALRITLLVGLAFILLSLTPQASFAAKRETTPFSFTAAGDYGSTNFTTLNLQAIEPEVDFHLALGDLSYGTPKPESAWCSYVQSNLLYATPFELLAGNHDDHDQGNGKGGNIDNFAACLPDNLGLAQGAYGKEYYFDYGGLARFILISPNLTFDGSKYDYTVGSFHYETVKNLIDDARAQGLKWVVVGMHENCISMGVKPCDIGADLLNLLVSKKVDLVLQGHDHDYQRSKQLRLSGACPAITPGTYKKACVADEGINHYYKKGKGTVIVIVGTGGKELDKLNANDSEAPYFAAAQGAGINQRYGIFYVNVTANQLDARFLPANPDSNFADNFRIGKSYASTVPLIGEHADWKFLDDGSNQGIGWYQDTYDDSSWFQGVGQFGYGDGDEQTVVSYGPDPDHKYVTTYFRKTFEVPDASRIVGLTLNLLRDDGAVVYLNGREVARSNMTWDFVNYDTYAATQIGGKQENKFFPYYIDALQSNFTDPPPLNTGDNLLAVELHQAAPDSSDLSFDLKLDTHCVGKPGKANTPIPPSGEDIGATTDPDFVILDWQSVPACLSSYKVVVREDATNGTIVDQATDLADSSYTTQPVLHVGHTYYWQVSACNTKCIKSPWWSFNMIQP